MKENSIITPTIEYITYSSVLNAFLFELVLFNGRYGGRKGHPLNKILELVIP